MAKAYIYPWNINSVGSRNLSKALSANRIRLEGSTFVGSGSKIVINWGASDIKNAEVLKCRVLNTPKAVAKASNKKTFFETIKGSNNPARIPLFTTDLDTALGWVEEGRMVMGRGVLQGSGGEGIVFFDEGDLEAFNKCRLFTEYKKKRDEYRVHIMGGEVILVQRKALRVTDDAGAPIEHENVNWRVRNHSNGFIFARDNEHIPADVIAQARLAIDNVGLDFGAVDVIWNDKEQRAYVLEANTAPGLEGTTISDYADGFAKVFGVPTGTGN
jgi:glutathione synthase/RimK-type ligase-like ATP-grasp enzyme